DHQPERSVRIGYLIDGSRDKQVFRRAVISQGTRKPRMSDEFRNRTCRIEKPRQFKAMYAYPRLHRKEYLIPNTHLVNVCCRKKHTAKEGFQKNHHFLGSRNNATVRPERSHGLGDMQGIRFVI